MVVRLVDCFVKALAYTLAWQKNLATAQPSLEAVKADYQGLWAQAEEEALAAGFSGADYQEARFAVAAFIDEMIMLADWAERDNWAPQSFQLKFYQTTNAGEEFFDRLKSLPADKNHVRETYLMCLSLGFTGMHYSPDRQNVLEQVKQTGLEELWAGRTEDEVDFSKPFPLAYPEQHLAGRTRSRAWGFNFLTLTLILLPPVLLVSLFVMYRLYLYKLIYDFFRISI